MNYVQALWRGVDQVRFEGATEVESSHPYFGRLVHYERFDSAGHWEAIQSHPQTGARFTIVLPGDVDVPIQPYANFHRSNVGHPDVFLRRCADELRSALERHTGRPLTEPCRQAFALEVVTLPVAAHEGGTWSASFYAATNDTHFEVRLSGDRVKRVAAFDFSG